MGRGGWRDKVIVRGRDGGGVIGSVEYEEVRSGEREGERDGKGRGWKERWVIEEDVVRGRVREGE